MKGKLISSEGRLTLLEAINTRKLKVELKLLNSKVNRNNWKYENLKEHKDLFAGTPILVAYVGEEIGDGHNFSIEQDENGETYASFLGATDERTVGYFASKEDIRIENIDGVEWIVGTGYIWTWYAKELVDKLKERGLEGMSISIETYVTKAKKDRASGVEIFTNYEILGTTILGDEVMPAVEDANIRVLAQLGCNAIKEKTMLVVNQREQELLNYEAEETAIQNSNEGETHKMELEQVKVHFDGLNVLSFNAEVNKAIVMDNDNTNRAFLLKTNEETCEITHEEIAMESKVVYEADGICYEESLENVKNRCESKINELEAKLNEITNAKTELETRLNAMTEKEISRRKVVVKKAIEDRVCEIKANSDVAADLCNDLLSDEVIDKYAHIENNGDFIGDTEITKEVDARYMNAIITNAKQKQDNVAVWGGIKSNETETPKTTIKDVVDSIKK